ncbi:hypothetical protein C8Q79DRAFT_908297 [Trametes meyenii]|nr:hypothetical protein C8Q79DRAFT_908297 [Trametes meyenii]
MAPHLPSIGTRLSHSGYLGTVRFVGLVDGAQGVWLGVEWDDPRRGKHDGVKDGKRYFTCLVPNAGSFIRPSSTVTYGVTFLSALSAKYIELPHGDTSSEKVVLGSSGGAIEVEAVNLDKIRGKLAHLERLREVSLDNECVSQPDPPGDIGRTCPGIRGLDLSKNLISGWDVVASISVELPELRRLSLNQNRLQLPRDLSPDTSAFRRLEELQLNATLSTWAHFREVLTYLPSLKAVELGYNGLRTLQDAHATITAGGYANTTVETLNLDGNELDNFADVCAALHILPTLRRLVLTSNRVAYIPAPPLPTPTQGGADNPAAQAGSSPVRGLRHIALAFNHLASWHDVDALPLWCPALESLTLTGNPLFEDPRQKAYARPYAISKIPSLKILDGATISPKERADSELLYLAHVRKLALSDAERRAEHPQWAALCTKHGASEFLTPAPKQDAQDTLSNRLISVHIYEVARAPPPSLPANELEAFLRDSRADAVLRVLSTMTVRTFRLKALKAFKVPRPQQSAIRLWMVVPDGHFVEMDEEYAGRDLSWWGAEEGMTFVIAGYDQKSTA